MARSLWRMTTKHPLSTSVLRAVVGLDSAPMNYAAAAAYLPTSTTDGRPRTPCHGPPTEARTPVSRAPAANPLPSQSDPRHRPSPSYIPEISSPTNSNADKFVYVLTLLTDKAHHTRMTSVRTKYFPPKINKLNAHLTLFHALPGRKLESSIIPTIIEVVNGTAPFEVHATRPFRLKKGIAIAVPKAKGGNEAEDVHRRLQAAWAREGFLSDQDATPALQVHYTVMNKVDDAAVVAEAMEEVKRSWKVDVGIAEGLGLWRYDRGWWRWEKGFSFEGEQMAER